MHTYRLSFVADLCWLGCWAMAALALSVICHIAVVSLGPVVLQPLYALIGYVHPLQSYRDAADLAKHGPRFALGLYYWAVFALALWPLLVIGRAWRGGRTFDTYRIISIICVCCLIAACVVALRSLFLPGLNS